MRGCDVSEAARQRFTEAGGEAAEMPAAAALGTGVPRAVVPGAGGGAALQQFIATAAAGMQEDDNASVVRLYARIAGIELAGGA